MGKLKLFVLGEFSADPDKWSGSGTRALAIASTAKEALDMVEFTNIATEIPLDKPMLLTVELVPSNL